MNTHWKKAFNKEFLGAHDLEEGEDKKLTIKEVKQREITNQYGFEVSVNVATFTDKKIKPMILNATACKQIQRFTGFKYIEKWLMVNIQVYVLEGVEAYGEIVDALRIRDMQPRMKKPVLNAKSDKWDDAIMSYSKAGDKRAQASVIRKHYQLSNTDLKLLIQASKKIPLKRKPRATKKAIPKRRSTLKKKAKAKTKARR